MIQNVSRRTLAILAGVGFTLATAGWMDAWKQRHTIARIQPRETAPAPTKSRNRMARSERTAMDLSDPLSTRLLMGNLRPEDSLKMHELFVDVEKSGRTFAEEYAPFSNRWDQIDGEGAMAYWAARVPLDMKGNDFGCVMNGWASADPQAALARIADHNELMDGENSHALALAGWFNKDQAVATRWLSPLAIATMKRKMAEQKQIS